MGDGHHHLLARDQVLVLDVGVAFHDGGAAGRGEGLAHGDQLVPHNAHDPLARTQDGQVAGDGVGQAAGLAEDLVAAQAGEAGQGQGQDGAGLLVGQADQAALQHHGAGVLDQADQLDHVVGGPVARAQPFPRLVGIGRRADQGDHLVDVGDRNRQAHQHVAAVARLGELELGAPDHDLFAELQEQVEQLAQPHLLRLAAVQRQHVDPERGLQRGKAVELVQGHVARRVPLQLDHHAHAVAVALVAQVADAFDLLLAHQLGDLLHHGGLVHLEGDLGDDDGFAITLGGFDRGLAAHDHRPPPGHQRSPCAGAADDLAAGGEVRPRHDLQQALQVGGGVVDQGEAGVHDLAQVMRRDVGGHADGDAACAVDQQVGDARGEHDGLVLGAVVVVLEVDRVLVDVGQQRLGAAGHAALGIAHGRGRIVVHGAEVALTVDQHQPHGEGLGHAHQGVIDRLVAVWVVLADHVAHDAGALPVGAAGGKAVLAHGEQDAPVHRLQPVARIGQRPAHDHAHGVVEIGALHLRLDGDGGDVSAAVG